MNMKRWLCAVCSVFLCVVLCAASVSVFAANVVIFSLSTDKATANVGDTVTVSVNITEKSYLANGTFYLHFDNTAVSYVADSENTGSAAGNGTMFAANGFHDEGFVKIALVTSSSIKKSGTLMTFDFRVLKKAAAAFSFTADECVGSGTDEIDFDIEYTSKGCVLNDDGSVTTPIITPDVPVVMTTTTKRPDTTAASKNNVVTTTASAATTASQHVPNDNTTTADAAVGDTTTASADSAVTTVSAQDKTEETSTTTRFLTEIEDPVDDEPDGLAVAIVIIVIAVLVAGGLTAAALVARKKRNADEPTVEETSEQPTEDIAQQDPTDSAE